MRGVIVPSKVAITEFDDGDVQQAFQQALKLIGGIDDLNTKKRKVVIKPGVFHHKKKNHPTLGVLNAIINGFDRAPQILVTESDNYKGAGSERLQIWREAFTKHVVPFNLSEDTDTKQVKIADENIGLSHILFKPNVFVSVHVLRKTEYGTILKNLLGLMPESKKARFHKKLPNVLMDAYAAIGGIDLAVIDGTYGYKTITSDKGVKANILIAGRDAVAVEAVGATVMGVKLEKMTILQEAITRGTGEGNVAKIQILGASIEAVKGKLEQQK
jgi:uncharacterized protein (DUF362 family)